MELFLALVLKLVMYAVGIFGGAAALENLLENYLMGHLPVMLRGAVVPFVSVLGAVFAHLHDGMAFWPSVIAAVTFWASTSLLHNNPATTTADTSAWNLDPPADALGVPGVK